MTSQGPWDATVMVGGHLFIYATSTATSGRHVRDVADCAVIRLVRLAIPERFAASLEGLWNP